MLGNKTLWLCHQASDDQVSSLTEETRGLKYTMLQFIILYNKYGGYYVCVITCTVRVYDSNPVIFLSTTNLGKKEIVKTDCARDEIF